MKSVSPDFDWNALLGRDAKTRKTAEVARAEYEGGFTLEEFRAEMSRRENKELSMDAARCRVNEMLKRGAVRLARATGYSYQAADGQWRSRRLHIYDTVARA